MNRTQSWRYFDFWLLGAVLVLCIFGIAMIRSAIAGNEVIAGSVQRQAIFVVGGLAVMFVVTAIDYHYWSTLARPMYIFIFGALAVIYVYGTARYGSARWLETGVIDIQPSELAKIIMILVMANFFARSLDKPHNMRWVLTSLGLVGGVVVWILLQPNLSTSIVLFVLWFTMIWLSGIKPKYLLILALSAVLLAAVAFPFLEEYQQGRIISFIAPDSEARYGDTYNVDQALITIGNGGWFGRGYGQGTQVQLRFLKVRHTDFIFSAMAEEIGFVGTVIVIGLIVFVILRCLRVARLAADPFGSLIAYGFAMLMFFQTAVNVGVNLRVIPVTGLTLPFISYGGSSLLSMVLGIGLVESVILRHKALDF